MGDDVSGVSFLCSDERRTTFKRTCPLYAESGPIGINSATYVGYAVTQSVWGAVLATVAVCLPSFILVLLISYFFAKCKDNKYIKAAMSGLLPMSVALIASAALLMMNRENFIDYKSIGIFAAAFLVTWKWNLHPILLICLAGVVGLLLY